MSVNKDLIRERKNCTFNIKELTEFFDGGPQKTSERKNREKLLLSKRKELFDSVPLEYLGHKEKYEEAIKRDVILFGLIRQMQSEGRSNITSYGDMLSNLLRCPTSCDGSPLVLHYIMFIPVFLSQADEEQQKEWFPRAWNCSIIGSYAQTELGHGTFIRGLETTATYDPDTKEFVLNSPSLTSYKWWPGGLGNTANYCIVIAQLYTKGQCHGIHSFIIQVRDEDTHMPLPGVKVGEIGPKMGLNVVNNGFMGFDNVRIPRRHMLMKHAQVLEDGTYVKSPNSKLNYGAMVFVRVVIVYDTVNYLTRAATVATRYSAVRRQCQPDANQPECQILDYVTQQHKIFISIAAGYAMKLTANKLFDIYNLIYVQISDGNLDRLPELHALACCLKAVTTSDTTMLIEKCRLACGGYGYMLSSSLPQTFGFVSASCTYEGDNTVLLLQTARFLVKTWQNVQGELTPTVQYMRAASAEDFASKWENSAEGVIRAFQLVSTRKIASCVKVMTQRVKSGMTFADAWNTTSVQLVSAAEIHCRVIIITTFYEDVKKAAPTLSPPLREVLYQLVDLYAAYWALEKLQEFLKFTSMSKTDADSLQAWYEELLGKIRPNAVGLVDAFDVIDEILQSTLGAYDGRVYERLMEEALKSPLNAEPVNRSFHMYLKPFMQGKLKIASCVKVMTQRVKSGMTFADAWNTTSVQLVSAAEIHCRVIIITTFYEDVKKAAPTLSPPLREVLYQLVDLYAAYWALEKLQEFLKFTSMSKTDADSLQAWYEELLGKIRPNAVGLVDAFDVIDEILQSTLGAYDGRVYERLMEEALKSPLNAEPVNRSFHMYLKPFMQGKL